MAAFLLFEKKTTFFMEHIIEYNLKKYSKKKIGGGG